MKKMNSMRPWDACTLAEGQDMGINDEYKTLRILF
jgi:hypothetical protein